MQASLWPEADQLFRGDSRWIGGDGAYAAAREARCSLSTAERGSRRARSRTAGPESLPRASRRARAVTRAHLSLDLFLALGSARAARVRQKAVRRGGERIHEGGGPLLALARAPGESLKRGEARARTREHVARRKPRHFRSLPGGSAFRKSCSPNSHRTLSTPPPLCPCPLHSPPPQA